MKGFERRMGPAEAQRRRLQEGRNPVRRLQGFKKESNARVLGRYSHQAPGPFLRDSTNIIK